MQNLTSNEYNIYWWCGSDIKESLFFFAPRRCIACVCARNRSLCRMSAKKIKKLVAVKRCGWYIISVWFFFIKKTIKHQKSHLSIFGMLWIYSSTPIIWPISRMPKMCATLKMLCKCGVCGVNMSAASAKRFRHSH